MSETYKAMMRFKQDWSQNLWEETEERFLLFLVDHSKNHVPELILYDIQTERVIERWGSAPAVDELAAAAFGECSCQPESDACPTCQVLARMVHSDELPF